MSGTTSNYGMGALAYPHRQGFTLVEVLVSFAVATAILAALVTSFVHLYSLAESSKRQAKSQADSIRIVDYIARDLRSATSVTLPAANTLSDGGTLTIQVVDFYNSNTVIDSGYKTIKTLYSNKDGEIGYGGASGAVQSYITITYTMLNGIYTRTENGVAEVIARDSEDTIDIDIELEDSKEYLITAYRAKAESTLLDITSSDRILIRNPQQ